MDANVYSGPRKWPLQALNRGPQVTKWVGTEVGVALRSLEPQAQYQLFHKGEAPHIPHDLHSVDDPGGEQVWDHVASWGSCSSAKGFAILSHPLNKPQLLPCQPGLWPPPRPHLLFLSLLPPMAWSYPLPICSASSVCLLPPGGLGFPTWGPGFLPRALS